MHGAVTKSICLVSPFAGNLLYGGKAPGGGGAERQLILIARGLVNAGWKVTFIIAPCSVQEPVVDARVQVAHVPFRYLGGPKFYWLVDGWALGRAIGRSRASIVGLRSGGPYVLLVLLLYRALARMQLVMWIQNDRDVLADAFYDNETAWFTRLPKRIYTFLLGRADLLVAQTSRQQEAVQVQLKKSAIVIPSLVDSLFEEGPDIQDDMPSSPYVLWAGNPSANKRADLVIALADRMPQVDFVIAMNPGDQHAMDRIQSLASERSNIRFLGAVAPRDMERWFMHAACLLNTSLAEGFPNTFLQAWSHGVPVVTAGVDPSGIIERWGLGVVAENQGATQDTVKGIAAALASVLSDVALRQSIAEAAQRYIAQQHNAPASVALIDSALMRLSENTSRRNDNAR